jgi:peptide/nickel transport system substrate-binding protein
MPIVRSQSQQGGTLILTLYFDIDSLNVFTMGADPSFRVTEKIYDTMLIVLTNGSYYPWLATSWEISSDAKTYTFHLRQGVKWHDGQPFTSEDVKFTFDLAKNNSALTNLALAVSELESVETPDDYTVVFHLKQALVPFLLYAGTGKIVPKHIWQNITNPERYPNEHPIGTGPFKFVSRSPGQQIVLEANDEFWGGRPHIDGIIFKIYTNADARVLALLTGEVDGAGNIPSTLIGSIIGVPNVTVIKRPSIQANNWLGYNFRVYPFNIRQVRQAMDLAIDKKFIFDSIEMGIAMFGSDGCITPAMAAWAHPDAPLWKGKGLTEAERIARANALLDDLGFAAGPDGVRVTPNGTRLEFELLTLSAIPDYVRAAEAIAKDLEKIGMKINVRPMETNTVINIVYGSPVGEYDMYIMGCGYDADPDASLYLEFFSNPPIPSWTADAQAYSNSTLNELLMQQRVEPDLERRKQLVYRIQEILADDLPIIMMFHRVGIAAHRTDKYTGWDDEEGIYSQFTALNVRLITPPSPTTTVVTEVPSWVSGVAIVAVVAIVASVGYSLTLRRKSGK